MARYIVQVQERAVRIQEVQVTAKNKRAAMEAAMEVYEDNPILFKEVDEEILRARAIGARDIDLPEQEPHGHYEEEEDDDAGEG